MAVIALSLGFIFTACNKEEKEVAPKEAQQEEVAVEDNASGLSESDEIVAIADDAMNRGGAGMRIAAGHETYESAYGATITVTKNANSTGTITIDFGAGVTGSDGRTRKGKILVDYSGQYHTSNSRQVITFSNYYVNEHKIEGKKTLLTATDLSGSSYPIFVTLIQVEGGKITWKDGKITEWSGERTRRYDYKNTLLDLNDDVLTITGTITGKSRDGVGFTATTTSPLVLSISCAISQKSWLPLQGMLEVTPQAGSKRTVNYGSGNCDRTFTVSVNNKSWDITAR